MKTCFLGGSMDDNLPFGMDLWMIAFFLYGLIRMFIRWKLLGENWDGIHGWILDPDGQMDVCLKSDYQLGISEIHPRILIAWKEV